MRPVSNKWKDPGVDNPEEGTDAGSMKGVRVAEDTKRGGFDFPSQVLNVFDEGEPGVKKDSEKSCGR